MFVALKLQRSACYLAKERTMADTEELMLTQQSCVGFPLHTDDIESFVRNTEETL